MRVKVNRDHVRHRWTVCAEDGRRIGHCIGMLLRDVEFPTQGPSGWAVGTLVSWADMQLDKKFHEKLEARIVSFVQAAGENFWPLEFREVEGKGGFYVWNARIKSCSWLRILGREAECTGSVADV